MSLPPLHCRRSSSDLAEPPPEHLDCLRCIGSRAERPARFDRTSDIYQELASLLTTLLVAHNQTNSVLHVRVRGLKHTIQNFSYGLQSRLSQVPLQPCKHTAAARKPSFAPSWVCSKNTLRVAEHRLLRLMSCAWQSSWLE
jgi:hypothetical protein